MTKKNRPAKRNPNAPVRYYSAQAVHVEQKQRAFRLLKMKARDLAKVSYVAPRGVSAEEGAVQRILSPRRIASLKAYAITGGDYPACIVLNWVNERMPLKESNGTLRIPIVRYSAQIIDGQHRVEGLKEAIQEHPATGDIELPVAMYEHLGTQACADIFLSINTEQKPVPKSLVYDLYALASDYIVDYAASRAKDIATVLNEDEHSPYSGMIKFPGRARTKGGVALSTVVSGLKPFVAEKGIFDQAGIRSLENQANVVVNYFAALRRVLDRTWDDRDNAFNYAAGFSGAMDFLKSHLFDYCVRHETFTVKSIAGVIRLSPENRVLQSELKGLGGTKARQYVAERLVESFEPEDVHDPQFAF